MELIFCIHIFQKSDSESGEESEKEDDKKAKKEKVCFSFQSFPTSIFMFEKDIMQSYLVCDVDQLQQDKKKKDSEGSSSEEESDKDKKKAKEVKKDEKKVVNNFVLN